MPHPTHPPPTRASSSSSRWAASTTSASRASLSRTTSLTSSLSSFSVSTLACGTCRWQKAEGTRVDMDGCCAGQTGSGGGMLAEPDAMARSTARQRPAAPSHATHLQLHVLIVHASKRSARAQRVHAPCHVTQRLGERRGGQQQLVINAHRRGLVEGRKGGVVGSKGEMEAKMESSW